MKDELESMVTRYRSQTDVAQAALEATVDERDVAVSMIVDARQLLKDAYYQLDPYYLDDGVTLHPGCVSTLHDLYAYLWPNGKPANAP